MTTARALRASSLLAGWLFLLSWMPSVANGGTETTPRRVISLSPHFTEIVYDIGAGDRLIAVTDFCRFPDQAKKLPKVGGFLDVNIENIVRMKPDLVMAVPFFGPKLDVLRRQHLKVFTMEDSQVADVLDAYDALGRLFGLEKKAASAKQRLQKKLSAIRPLDGPRPTAMFVAGTETGSLAQMTVAGRGAFTHELMEQAGFRNVFRDMGKTYLPVSKESVLSRDPDVIFHVIPSSVDGEAFQERLRQLYAGWKSLRAVQQGNVFFITEDGWTIPGPTMAGLGEFFMKIRKAYRAKG